MSFGSLFERERERDGITLFNRGFEHNGMSLSTQIQEKEEGTATIGETSIGLVLEKDRTDIFPRPSTFGVLARKRGIGSNVQRHESVGFIPISHDSAAPKEQ